MTWTGFTLKKNRLFGGDMPRFAPAPAPVYLTATIACDDESWVDTDTKTEALPECTIEYHS